MIRAKVQALRSTAGRQSAHAHAVVWMLTIFTLWSAVGWAVELPGRSISSSGQFIIYAESPLLRMSASSAAEQTRESLSRLFKERKRAWELPVVVSLKPRPVGMIGLSPAEIRAVQTVQGIRIEIKVHTGPSPVPVDFHRRIVHALLLERALRGQGATLPAKMADVPIWLTLGLAELTSSAPLPSSLYAGLLESGNIPELDVFVTNPPAPNDASMDATIYRAYAAALVSAILSQPGGLDRFDTLVSDAVLNPSPGGLASLEPVFEQGGGIEPFSRQWVLALAYLGRTDASQGLATEHSVKKLREALNWPIYLPQEKADEEKSIPLREVVGHVKSRSVKNQLRETSAKLVADTATANPIVAPLYSELAVLCQALADGKAKNPELTLERIETTLDEINNLAAEITDHINWLEATQVKPTENPFTSYFLLAESLSATKNQRPPRGGDPIAAYLDGMERLLE